VADSSVRKIETSVCKVDKKLGLIFLRAIVCKVDGEPYYDLGSVDEATGEAFADHITEEEMLEAVTDFMLSARTVKDMHAGEPRGVVVHSWPETAEVAKAYGEPEPRITGWKVAVKADADLLSKMESGEYTGSSIGGRALRVKETA
jgi:hypothetical protein